MISSFPTHGLEPFHPPISLSDWSFFLNKLRDHLCEKISVRTESLTTSELADLSRVLTNANTLQNNLARDARYNRGKAELMNAENLAQALADERKSREQ